MPCKHVHIQIDREYTDRLQKENIQMTDREKQEEEIVKIQGEV